MEKNTGIVIAPLVIEEYLGTRLSYEFNTYKLLNQDEEQLRANPNPFAIVVLTVLMALKNKDVGDEKLKQIKLDLTTELIKRKLGHKKQDKIMAFIAYYVNFEKREMMIKFEKEVEQLTGRTTPMGVKEILLERRKREGIREGIIEGIEQGEANKNYEFVERLIEKLGFSDEQIMDVVNVSIDFVKNVRGELASRKIEA